MSSPTTSSPERERIGVRFVSDAVKRDHRSLERLYTALLADTDGVPDRRRELQRRLCWELARHLVAMNLFVFPGTTRRASQGNENARGRQQDFAVLRERLLDLEAAGGGREGDGVVEDGEGDGEAGGHPLSPLSSSGQDQHSDFRGALLRLKEVLVRHIKDVERTDLVAIEKVLSGEESERLARDFEATIFFIPADVRAGSDGLEGVEGAEGAEGVKAPFKTIKELLDANVGELMGYLEGFPRD